MKLNNNLIRILKTITWRLIATGVSIVLIWYLTGDIKAGIKVGIFDVTVKLILYYYHDMIWDKIKMKNNEE